MAFNLYPNGAGGTTGDQIAVNAPLILGTTGHVWYVNNSVAGSADAASPAGREREKPLKTLSQAVTNAAGGDVVILGLGHSETISVALSIVKALTIVGEGAGSSRPRLTSGVIGAAFMLAIQNTGTSLNNIYFPASTGLFTTGGRVQFAASGEVCDNCYFECGANDVGGTIQYFTAVNSCQLTNAYFLATGGQPAIAVQMANASTGFFMENCTFDGGGFGYSDFAFKATGVLAAVYANQIHQLNNADVSLAATWTGVWNVGQKSGSARFEG